MSKGYKWTEEQRTKLKGRVPWNKHMKGNYTNEMKQKLGREKGCIPWNVGVKDFKNTEVREKWRNGDLIVRVPKRGLNLCECGCNELCKNRFVSGHNFKVQKTKYWLGKVGSRKGCVHTEESKSKIKAKRALQVISDESKRKGAISRTGLKRGPETIQKMSASAKRTWKNEEIAKKRFCGMHRRPNGAEIFVDKQIQIVRPKDFVYSGDGKIWIEGRNPDWFNINGKKQVIEFFGRQYHKSEDEKDRLDHYKRYGYDCLVIWAEELKDLEKLKNKILSF
jgi:hypothetical protein